TRGELPAPPPDKAAFLGALPEQEGEAARVPWLPPTATPYQPCRLHQYGDCVFHPFRFEHGADADRYVTLVRDVGRCVATIGDKVAGQGARCFRIHAPALAGVRTT
ncbi:hypothetical protein ADK64_11210, partial [Streptomyces sp. MMG1121]